MNLDQTTGWRGISAVPDLNQFEIHVWRISPLQDAAEAARLENCLIPPERQRAERYHFDQDRKRFVIRRAVLRHLLGAYLDSSPAAVCLLNTIHGKPFLEHQETPEGLQFSCSHSADLALIAITRGQKVGIDLEFHRPFPQAGELAGAFFSPLEIAELAKAPDALKETIFFDCWTQKEAFVKAIGLGLSFPLNRFSIPLSPDQTATRRLVNHDSQNLEPMFIQSLDVSPHCSAALAFEHKDTIVKCFDWSSPLSA